MNTIRTLLLSIAILVAACVGSIVPEHVQRTALASGTGGGACACPSERHAVTYGSTNAAGGVANASVILAMDAPAGVTVDNGFALISPSAQTYGASAYLILSIYDCASGGTTIPTSGCTMLAQWSGASSTVAASTATALTPTGGTSFPYTLGTGHSLQTVWAKVGSVATPSIHVATQ